jgi:hypothetical protein
MKFRSWTACMAVVAAATGAGAATASAATVNFDVPVSGTVFNDCTAEWVTITGTQHVKVTDNSTAFELKSQIEMNLTGVKGTGVMSGARYVMNDQTSDMQHADFDPFGDAQLTIENSTILTRQGETGALLMGDDFRLHALTHLTVVNGVTKSDKTDLRADCR